MVRSTAHRHPSQASGKKEIPTFYFPQGQPISPSVRGQMEDKVEALLQRHDAGLTVPAIKELFTEAAPPPPPHSVISAGGYVIDGKGWRMPPQFLQWARFLYPCNGQGFYTPVRSPPFLESLIASGLR